MINLKCPPCLHPSSRINDALPLSAYYVSFIIGLLCIINYTILWCFFLEMEGGVLGERRASANACEGEAQPTAMFNIL